MIGATVQARMSSKRLPGKVLMPLAGKPMLGWVVERLREVEGLDAIVVATSLDLSDDPIKAWCFDNGVTCFRGSLNDVADRLLTAGRMNQLDAIVRINGDSPLLDPKLVTLAVKYFDDVDVVTNVWPKRTCPPGQSVEVIALDALRRAMPLMDAHDREHVTPALYRHPEQFKIKTLNVWMDGPSMALDQPEDVRLIEAML